MNISEVILDSLADDFESISQIQNYLAYCGYAEDMHKLGTTAQLPI